MGLKQVFAYYYGRLKKIDSKKNLADDLLVERENTMMQESKEMEDRLKRHITECKREIIKEIQTIFSDFKSSTQTKKEVKHVRKSQSQ